MVVQVLDEPEDLDTCSFILLFCRRDVETRTYSEKIPHKFTFLEKDKHPTIITLKNCCRDIFNLQEDEPIDICKFIPW